MDPTTRANRIAWEHASQKHVREYAELLAEAADGSSLLDVERHLLRPMLARSPRVVHLQSGHGLDDIALVRAGAASVVGVDYSEVAVRAAQRRADEPAVSCRYVVAALPGAPLRAGCADLVYTGKGGLIWMPDLAAWARDTARLLRPQGHLFVYEGHPAVPLWSWDEDAPRIRPDRSYFSRTFTNDTFPRWWGRRVAVDAGRARHRGGRRRTDRAPPGGVPGAVLASGGRVGGSMGRAAPERLLPARFPVPRAMSGAQRSELGAPTNTRLRPGPGS